jgi:hypothetical protein
LRHSASQRRVLPAAAWYVAFICLSFFALCERKKRQTRKEEVPPHHVHYWFIFSGICQSMRALECWTIIVLVDILSLLEAELASRLRSISMSFTGLRRSSASTPLCLRQHGTPHFSVVRFRARSAKTNNDRKKSTAIAFERVPTGRYSDCVESAHAD